MASDTDDVPTEGTTTDSDVVSDGDGATVRTESAGGDAFREGFVDRTTAAKILVGFVVAGVLIYLLGVVVGWNEIFSTLAGADFRWLAIACVSTAICLAAWGKAWQVVLGVLGIDVPFRKLVVTYYAATFANYVTPLGQAGGEPFIAYVLSKDTEANFEDSLASVVTADLLNLLPFFNFAALGLGFLLLQASLPERAEFLAQGLAVLAVGVPGLIYVGWRHRDGVEGAVLRFVRPIAGRTKRISVEGVRRRIDRFYASLERIAAEPWQLAYALTFSYAGWVFFALPLYFAGRTLGLPVDILVVLFVVPASTLAGLTPLPGGVGGVEIALVVLLVALTPLAAGPAAAVALVYRLASYWFALVIGGLATMWVIARA